MNKGDKVKHKNVYIQGEVVGTSLDNERVILHVQCDGGTYYDSTDNWEIVIDETVGEEVLQVNSVEEV